MMDDQERRERREQWMEAIQPYLALKGRIYELAAPRLLVTIKGIEIQDSGLSRSARDAVQSIDDLIELLRGLYGLPPSPDHRKH